MAQTKVAVLGTLAEFHNESIPFDLRALVELVADLNPDLLCLDLPPERWNQRRFDDLPPEYRKGLIPLAEQSDVVVVPIGQRESPQPPAARGLRRSIMRWLRRGLARLQRGAPDPGAINYGWRHDLANLIYFLIERVSERDLEVERETHTQELIESIKRVAARDPGSRVLVVVNVQYCHKIRPRLREEAGLEVVKFHEL